MSRNALAIVVEVDRELLPEPGGGPLFGVVAETVAAGKLPIHRSVRPPGDQERDHGHEKFDQVNRDLEIRDLYNLEDAFHLGKDYPGAYRARLNANLAWFDSLDGTIDWPPGPDGAHPLTELLLADYMAIDVSKPNHPDSFLEIERAAPRTPTRDLRRAIAGPQHDGDPLHGADSRPQRQAPQRRRWSSRSRRRPASSHPVRADELPLIDFARRVGLVAGAH